MSCYVIEIFIKCCSSWVTSIEKHYGNFDWWLIDDFLGVQWSMDRAYCAPALWVVTPLLCAGKYYCRLIHRSKGIIWCGLWSSARNDNTIQVVVYYTVSLSIEVNPMGLCDSLNRFTLFTQPPCCILVCCILVSGRLCLFTLSPGLAHSQRLSMVRYTTRCRIMNLTLAGFEPSPIQHLPAGSKYAITKLIRLPQ